MYLTTLIYKGRSGPRGERTISKTETDHSSPHETARALHREQSHPERSTERSSPASTIFLLSGEGEDLTGGEAS
jgi:hypothetical protein